MSATDTIRDLLERNVTTLLDVAASSIQHGLERGKPLAVRIEDFAEELHGQAASFVTLTLAGKLRGCTGSAYAHRPLVADVAHNAFASAFSDPRFKPLSPDEAGKVKTELSVLTAPEEVDFSDEQDLLAKMRPGIDGLILILGDRRGLFLPQVWDQAPGVKDFLHHLKLKAGLKGDFWSPDIRIQRFEAVKASAD